MKKIIVSYIFAINLLSQTYKDDSLIVQAIIDLNNLTNVVVEDVSDSLNGRIGGIDLTNLNISILPENIGNLTYLGEIDIYGHQLKELPNSFWNITSLVELAIEHGKLEVIPDEIENLSNLEVLYLDSNNLSTLPMTIINLSKIEKNLDVRYNHLCNLPEEIVEWIDANHWCEDWLSTQTPVAIKNMVNKKVTIKKGIQEFCIYNLQGRMITNNYKIRLSNGIYIFKHNKSNMKHINFLD